MTLVTNIGQPYTWYDDHGTKDFDLTGNLSDRDWEIIGGFLGTSGFLLGSTVGPGGALAGFFIGAYVGTKVGAAVKDFLESISDTYDTHTHPFGIWIDGGLAQEFTTGSNSFGYDMSSVAIYGRYFPDQRIEIPPSLSLWSSSNGVPGVLLYTLPFTKWGNDGSYGLRLEYQAPVAAILEPGTRYVVVIGYLDQTRVVITSSVSEDAGALAGWSIGNSLRKKNGDVWRTLTPADAGRRVFPADQRPVLRTEVRGTSLNSSSIIVSLTKVGEGQLKATATASAPFDIVLPLTVNSGTGASSATIPANSTESEVLTVSRTPGTTLPVSVDIGDLPNVPSTHSEYALFKSPSRLSVQVIDGVPGGVVPVCDRTPEVRDSIVKAAPVGSCGEVTEAHLSGITALYFLNNQNIKALKAGDLSGMPSLTSLDLGYNDLTTLPDGIFDGLTSLGKLDFYLGNFTSVPDAVLRLTSLTSLNLGYNPLSSLPAGTFDRLTQLTRLDLSGDNLGALPVGIFDHLTELQRLNLEYARITSLPNGVFDNLTSLASLNLDGLRSASLPDGVFFWLASLKSLSLRDSSLGSLSKDAFFGLSGLASLNLYGNRLTNLPSGIFSGLSSLTSLNLSRGRLPPLLDPLSLTVSLEKVGEGQFKAVAPTGAPFPILMLLSVTNGSIVGGASSIAIPTGRVDSDTLTVTRTTGTTDPVAADIRTLPSLPTDVNQYGSNLHQGYTLVKSPDLPLEVLGRGVGEALAATDFNGDGRTDFVDFFLFADAYGGTDARFDLDGSGTVDFADFFKFVDAFGA